MQGEDADPLDALSQEFLRRHRAGECLEVEAFAAAHPEHAEGLRELLPTLLALETVKRERESSTGGQRRASVPQLSQLGDFRIVRELGRGGMGVVFEAVQESLDRRVALKVLPQASLLTERQLARFRREAHIAAQLHHSHIVPVFGSGESDGYHWYAMQYIAGQSLDRWREEEAQRPPVGSGAWRSRARFVAKLGAQAAEGLHHAHQHGTLHRDIKPANLLLDQDGHVWVTDFGLAKALEEEGLTHSGDLLGTLQYMAPEQFAGAYDARSEVYALGVTLYELLALRHAYVAKSRSELLESIRTKQPADLRKLCLDLPEDLALIVEKSMSRDPADRYQDAEALARDLHAFLEDRPIAARRQSALGLLVRWCRRNRAVSALAAATVAAVVGAAGYGWTMYGITADALSSAKASAQQAEQATSRAEANLRLSLSAFSDVFDALVGEDPVLAIDEDPETGEAVVLTPSVRPQNVALLEQMLSFYDAFASQNEASQSLRLDTARAYRRVGSIQSRFGKFEEAARAYDRSLERYQFVTERDVSRELASVHVDYGRLEQRRGNMQAAAERYRRALQLLDNPLLGHSRGIRLERAEAHYQLARSFEFRGPLVGRPERAGQPPPAGAAGRGVELETVRNNLNAAREIAAQLRQEDPQDPEAKALEARCLCFVGVRRGRGPDGMPGLPEAMREAFTKRDQQYEAGLAMFRELVEAHPEVEAYRFELCNVLAGDPRRVPRYPRPRTEDLPQLDAELTLWREALGHAEKLIQLQPEFADYRALRMRTGLGYGGLLRLRATAAQGEEQRAMREEAATQLRAALDGAQALVESGAVSADSAEVAAMQLAARLLLAQALHDLGRISEAKVAVRALFVGMREASATGRPERGRWLDRMGMESAARLVERIGDAELTAEFEVLRASMPHRGEPREERPGEPRRR